MLPVVMNEPFLSREAMMKILSTENGTHRSDMLTEHICHFF